MGGISAIEVNTRRPLHAMPPRTRSSVYRLTSDFDIDDFFDMMAYDEKRRRHARRVI